MKNTNPVVGVSVPPGDPAAAQHALLSPGQSGRNSHPTWLWPLLLLLVALSITALLWRNAWREVQ